jgi:hypothetical protein
LGVNRRLCYEASRDTVDVIAVMSSLKCRVEVLCLQAVELDLRYYTSDARVRDQLRALYACVGLLAVEKDPQEVCAGMVDAAGILEDLAKAMLEAGLAKDANTSDAQA